MELNRLVKALYKPLLPLHIATVIGCSVLLGGCKGEVKPTYTTPPTQTRVPELS